MRTDDDEDFGRFVTACGGRLLHAADLLTGDRSRAEDLVQHALERAWLRWPRIRDGNPEAYVRRTMLNAYLDWWRRRRWRELPEDAGGGADRPSQPDHAVDVARRDAVQRALSALTARERAVVVLRFWCDLTEAQIAAELRVRPGTVKSTLARATERLRGTAHQVAVAPYRPAPRLDRHPNPHPHPDPDPAPGAAPNPRPDRDRTEGAPL
jgi:RNA polymerase sigma-70 factor (sigma-E family)